MDGELVSVFYSKSFARATQHHAFLIPGVFCKATNSDVPFKMMPHQYRLVPACVHVCLCVKREISGRGCMVVTTVF